MKKIFFVLILAICSISLNVSAQVTSGDTLGDFLNGSKNSASKSFAKIDEYLVKNNADFDNGGEVIRLFNQERVRLGTNFESELWKYLGNDFAKHYWINIFLEDEDYLQGNQPLPQLALKIREKGLQITVSDDDYSGQGMKFTIMRKLTVDLYSAGKIDLAIANKKKAEILYEKIKDFGVVGADSEYVICVYENLENKPQQCQVENKPESQNASNTFSGGILNGRATFLPAPEYPKAASAVGVSGSVNVQVDVDKNGNVISAKAISGHQLLQSAAVEAAKKAQFQPFMQNGQTIKVSGIIVYNFNK